MYTYTTTDLSSGEEKKITINDFAQALSIESSILENDKKRTSNIVERIRAIVLAMSEIRFALNFPSVDENQTGLGENTKLRPMFEADHITELRVKYIQLSTTLVNLIIEKKQIDAS